MCQVTTESVLPLLAVAGSLMDGVRLLKAGGWAILGEQGTADLLDKHVGSARMVTSGDFISTCWIPICNCL